MVVKSKQILLRRCRRRVIGEHEKIYNFWAHHGSWRANQSFASILSINNLQPGTLYLHGWLNQDFVQSHWSWDPGVEEHFSGLPMLSRKEVLQWNRNDEWRWRTIALIVLFSPRELSETELRGGLGPRSPGNFNWYYWYYWW